MNTKTRPNLTFRISRESLCEGRTGFIAFFCRAAWRERSVSTEWVWFVFLALGNIAMSRCAQIEVCGLKSGDGVPARVRRKTA
jgi:hypothetical protein